MQARICNWTDEAGNAHNVKNLGWILRHWQDVASVEWKSSGLRLPDFAGIVTFTAKPGAGWRYYNTDWADFSVFRHWISRPVFRGLPLKVDGQNLEA